MNMTNVLNGQIGDRRIIQARVGQLVLKQEHYMYRHKGGIY